jgi:pyruvate,orthophosphate dikinase
MQVRAIFEAACMVKKEEIDVYPEIMIPIVMNKKEIRHIRYGKKAIGIDIKGIEDVYKEVVREYGIDNLYYKIGSMVELPSASLLSDELAEYAEFFSYGTNDLTQTTYGISRDDISSFLPDYTKYDLFTDNPFKVLGDAVKQLMEISAKKGRMVRPDITLGLCGEHGAEPKNIEFCKKIGLNYVSTSPYSIPIAKLSIAQLNIKEENNKEKKK